MKASIPFILLFLFLAACNPCNKVNCLNGGSCMDGNCQCISPYTGKNCETNSCDSVVCNNGGTCVNGVCSCAAGYEGVNCNSIITAKFVGNFLCAQQCGSATSSYNVNVSATGSTAASNITFSYLNNIQPVAVVSGYSINIQSQVLQTGQTVSGNGQLSLNGDTISLSMTVIPYGSSSGNTCSYTLTR